MWLTSAKHQKKLGKFCCASSFNVVPFSEEELKDDIVMMDREEGSYFGMK